jgi:adenylate kinase family enzyme
MPRHLTTTTRRIRVVGTSGSGKTTLAAELARALGLDHVELDSLHHGPGWEAVPADEFERRVDARVGRASTGWVMCGNYLDRAPIGRWSPDVVVWLDLPRRVVMRRVVARTFGRLLTRRELWNGNRESVSGLWRRDGIVRWAWRTHGALRARYAGMMAAAATTSTAWVRLHSPAEVRAWLDRQAT